MRSVPVLFAVVLFGLTGCGGAKVDLKDTPAPGSSGAAMAGTSAPAAPAGFTVTSAAFREDTQIPVEYSCNGGNVPPPLRWQHVPTDAEALALVVDDPDAPRGRYVHWVVTGIPPSTTEIAEGALPDEATVSLNSGGKAEYLGPCPPDGTGVHHYRFQVYALSKPLTLAPTTPASESTVAIANLAVAVASTVGLFGR